MSASRRPEGRAALGLLELIEMGVGGMIGGGIFSVLGLAVSIAGAAAPYAFAIGSVIAFAAGYSYIRLALTYRDDGASFTYLERAFPHRLDIAGIAGWTIVVGYVGTLALYAFTFGAYGADLLGKAGSGVVRMALSAAVLVFFLLVNLKGARASGHAEDLVVYAKILLLGVFAAAGLSTIDSGRLVPLTGADFSAVLVAGALIFVAYEGFELITNAVCETRDPARNIPRGIYGSIVVTSVIYVVLAVVGVGNLGVAGLVKAEEYALAAAAYPVLGQAGVVLVGFAALLATASAINATAFGAARMMAEMAIERRVPKAFSFRTRTDVPAAALVVLIALAMAFALAGRLEVIAAFASMTFLIVSMAITVANIALRAETKSRLSLCLAGLVLMAATAVLLAVHLARTDPATLAWIGAIYAAVVLGELAYGRHAPVSLGGRDRPAARRGNAPPRRR